MKLNIYGADCEGWELLDKRMTIDHLGYLPGFLVEADPRGAVEQFDERYIAGWNEFRGHVMRDDHSLKYPGDPAMPPLAQRKFHDELVLFYDSAWVAVVEADGKTFHVARLD